MNCSFLYSQRDGQFWRFKTTLHLIESLIILSRRNSLVLAFFFLPTQRQPNHVWPCILIFKAHWWLATMSKNEEIVAPRGGASKCESILHFIAYGERNAIQRCLDMKTSMRFQWAWSLPSPLHFIFVCLILFPHVFSKNGSGAMFSPLRSCTSLALYSKKLQSALYHPNSRQLTNNIYSCFYRRSFRIFSSD